MSNSTTIVPSTVVPSNIVPSNVVTSGKTRGGLKRAAVEPVESEPVSKLVVSATVPNESVQRKENSNDVLVSTYAFICILNELNFKWFKFDIFFILNRSFRIPLSRH